MTTWWPIRVSGGLKLTMILLKQPGDKIDGQTTHYTVADQYGNVVSNTTTIEQVFGSGIMVPDYGFMLNNELTDFDAEPGGSKWRPGPTNGLSAAWRRQSSSTTISRCWLSARLEDRQSSLRSYRPSSILFEYDMECGNRWKNPRIFEWYESYTMKKGFQSRIIEQLNGMGHNFSQEPEDLGNVNSILIDRETGTFPGRGGYQ